MNLDKNCQKLLVLVLVLVLVRVLVLVLVLGLVLVLALALVIALTVVLVLELELGLSDPDPGNSGPGSKFSGPVPRFSQFGSILVFVFILRIYILLLLSNHFSTMSLCHFTAEKE